MTYRKNLLYIHITYQETNDSMLVELERGTSDGAKKNMKRKNSKKQFELGQWFQWVRVWILKLVNSLLFTNSLSDIESHIHPNSLTFSYINLRANVTFNPNQ